MAQRNVWILSKSARRHLFWNEEKKEAIECYQKALEFNKKDAWSYYKLACLLGIDDPSVVGYLENAKDILS